MASVMLASGRSRTTAFYSLWHCCGHCGRRVGDRAIPSWLPYGCYLSRRGPLCAATDLVLRSTASLDSHRLVFRGAWRILVLRNDFAGALGVAFN